ncbi:MAG: hypothetical protein K6F37_01835 [Lachnospiraceae bacterium]|nr:hypothetical protein [Lachnospiraceae bacterium]
MEKQTITVTIKTQGENCEMTDAEIKKWYEEKIAGLFNPEYGTPEITVDLKREITE